MKIALRIPRSARAEDILRRSVAESGETRSTGLICLEVSDSKQVYDNAGATRAPSCFLAFYLQPLCSVLWSQYESCHHRGRL